MAEHRGCHAVSPSAGIDEPGPRGQVGVNIPDAVVFMRSRTLLHGEFALDELAAVANGVDGIAGNELE
jgi:hypothetical protein